MKQLHNKLRSQRGASITWALLIFLVCTVIGSVVLTAGTTASGRISKQAEIDRRYFCVTSAVQLLVDSIDGQRVTVIQTRPYSEEDPGEFGDPEIVAADSSNVVLIQKAAIELVDCDESVYPDTSIISQILSLKVDDTASAEIAEDLIADGNLKLTVYNEGASAGDKFALCATFNADITDPIIVRTGNTETKTTIVTWLLNSVEKDYEDVP